MPHRTTRLTEENDKEIGKLHLAGVRIANLAKQFNVFPSSIRSALKFQNIIPINYKFRAKKDAFNDFLNEENCYWLGFIYADGSTSKKTGLSIGLKISDQKHLQKLHNFLELKNKIFISGSKANGVFYEKAILRCSDRILVEKLEAYGIVAGRPNPILAIKDIPNEMFHHFFRGLFDGDGCAHKLPRLTFLCQKELLDILRLELIKKVCVSEIPNPYRVKGIWRITYDGFRQTEKIKNYLYKDATIFMERKKDIINSWNSHTKTLFRKKIIPMF